MAERRAAVLLWLLLLSGAGSAWAAEAIGWDSLSAPERELLQEWEPRWASLPDEQQQRLRDNAQAWLRLTPEERAGFRARAGAWDALPAAERARRRERFEAFQRMPPEEQARLRREFQRFRGLPPEQRRRLREEFERMTPAERRAFLLGARARETAEVARRAFAFVPPEERPATLQMLREFLPEDRRRLRALAQRLPPPAREELRRELLARSVAERSAYLRERLGE